MTGDGPPSGLRRAIFSFLAIVVVPALALLAIEGGLRLVGYGYETSFLVERNLDGSRSLTNNSRFGWRFFPRLVARPGRPLRMLEEKPPGVYRVFVVGGSAALGDPQPDFGLPRHLMAMLEARRPDLRFEVVNAGMTAINSHVVLPIVRDLAAADPDLVVVYLGNNELVGPFGASSVFGVPGAGLPVARANVWVKTTRIGQLVDGVVSALRARRSGAGAASEWAGMETFLGNQVARQDPRLEVTYGNFRGNLQGIAAAAREAGADVILSTVGANLADCAPFASMPGPGLTEGERARFDGLLARGIAEQEAGRLPEALEAYREAAAIDEAHAELRFRLARTLAGLGRPAEVPAHYRAALEFDTCRFRADEGINGVIREVGSGAAGVHLADSERALQAESGETVVGAEFFDDHVHLTPRGNHVVARTVMEVALPLLPPPAPGSEPGPVLDLEAGRHRIGHTLIARFLALETMSLRRARPPFAGNLDEAEWQARIAEERGRLEAMANPERIRATIEVQFENLERHPDDWDLRQAIATLLGVTGNQAAALEQGRLIAAHFPFDGRSHQAVAATYAALGREDEAIAAYRRALELTPALSTARNGLSDALVGKGKRIAEREPAAALALFEEAARIGPESADAHHWLGTAYLRASRPGEAAAELQLAVGIEPGLAAAHKKLGDALAALSRPEEAATAYEAALAVNPRFFLAWVGLGDAQRAAGDGAAAGRSYRRALEIKPDAAEVFARLAELRRAE